MSKHLDATDIVVIVLILAILMLMWSTAPAVRRFFEMGVIG